MNEIFIKFSASVLIWVMYFGLFILWVIDGRIKKEQAAHAFFAAVLAWVIAEMIKEIFPTPRPFEINHLPILTLTDLTRTNGAFPSAHTASTFAMAVTVWMHEKGIGSAFLIGALFVGAGRILGNVHYPADILGGVVIGILVAFATERLHLFKILSPKAK